MWRSATMSRPTARSWCAWTFGKPVAWLSLPSEQAIKFALTILRRASLRGVIVVGDEVDAPKP